MAITIPRRFPGETVTGRSGAAEVNVGVTGMPSPSEYGSVARAEAAAHLAFSRFGQARERLEKLALAQQARAAFSAARQAKVLAAARAKEQEEKDLIYINHALTEWRKGWVGKVMELRGRYGRDSEGVTQALQDYYQESTKEITDLATSDSVALILEQKLWASAESDIVSIDIHERKERMESLRGGLLSNLEGLVINLSTSPNRMWDAIDDMKEYITAVVSVGGLTEREGVKLEATVQAGIIEEVMNAKLRTDPATLLREIKAGIYNNLTDAKTLREYKDKAKKYIDNKDKDYELIQKRKKAESLKQEKIQITETRFDDLKKWITDDLTFNDLAKYEKGSPESTEYRFKIAQSLAKTLKAEIKAGKKENSLDLFAGFSDILDSEALDMTEDAFDNFEDEIYEKIHEMEKGDVSKLFTRLRIIRKSKDKALRKKASTGYDKLKSTRQSGWFMPGTKKHTQMSAEDQKKNMEIWASNKALYDDYVQNNLRADDYDPDKFVDDILRKVNEDGIGNFLSGALGFLGITEGEFEADVTERLQKEKDIELEQRARGKQEITLPDTIKSTIKATEYLMSEYGMTKEEAVDWIRENN